MDESNVQYAQFWIDGFMLALKDQFGQLGVVEKDGIVYVELKPGTWIDFTRPMPSKGPSKEGA